MGAKLPLPAKLARDERGSPLQIVKPDRTAEIALDVLGPSFQAVFVIKAQIANSPLDLRADLTGRSRPRNQLILNKL